MTVKRSLNELENAGLIMRVRQGVGEPNRIYVLIPCLLYTSIQRTGALIFDETADRYDIRFDVDDYYGGLHCGDCMEVFVRGKWKPTRMEYGDNWYLVGLSLIHI